MYIYIVLLEYLWGCGTNFDCLMSYIKPGYKVSRGSLSSLKESTLTDDVMKS